MISKQILKFSVINILLSIISITQQANTIQGTLLKDQKYQILGPIVLPGIDRYVNIQFVVDNSPNLTYTYVEYFQGQSPSGNQGQKPSDFYGLNPTEVYYIDLEALQMGRRQYINTIPDNNTAYFKIVNLDPPQRIKDIKYTLLYKQGVGIDCPNCAQNTYLSTFRGKCICRTCPTGYQGYDCSKKVSEINLLSTIRLQISKNVFRYYRIDKSLGDLQIQISIIKGQAQIYAQYQTYDDQVANYLNVFRQNGEIGLFKLSKDYGKQQTAIIDAPLSEKSQNLLLTVIQYNNQDQAQLQIKIAQKQYVPIIMIIAISLGGCLYCLCCILTALCTVYCCKYRNQIEVLDPPQEILEGVVQKLTKTEINKYFPEFSIEQISDNSQASMANIATDKYISPDEQKECCICLCPISKVGLTRVGFCKHFYHSVCFVKWLKKQSNCPYCRYDFSINNIRKVYAQMLIAKGKIKLERLQLIKAILTLKQLNNMDEKQIDQIQVQV